MAVLEDGVARRLRDLLRSRGLDADLQAGEGPGRAGLLVTHDRRKIAIECEMDGPGKKRQAVGDAARILAPVRRADAAFAVIFPPKCSEKTLFHDTVLGASVVDDYVAGAWQDCPAPGAGGPGEQGGAPARVRWSKCTVAELADRIRDVHNDMGDPDTIAGRLRDAVDDAAGLLSDDECWGLGSGAGFKPRKDDWRPAARRALLAIASASLLHAWLDPRLQDMRPTTDARTGRRFRGPWNPESLDECYRSGDARESLSEAWSLILAIDYKPIFEMGLAALASLYGESFERAVRIVVNWSRYAAGQAVERRHDILGRVFGALLDDAQFDGSFYTSVPAATLLAGLAIPSAPARKDLKSLRVLDPACGTGTLLMAAAERLRGASGGDDGRMRLIVNALEGLDINTTALKIATTTLGMLLATAKFDDMNLYQMPLGVVEGTSKVATGSLELYAHGGLLPFIEWPNARPPGRIDADAGTIEHRYAYSADLVIMNPPYTRNDKRHDQLGEDVEARVKKRESEILAMSPVRLDRTRG